MLWIFLPSLYHLSIIKIWNCWGAHQRFRFNVHATKLTWVCSLIDALEYFSFDMAHVGCKFACNFPWILVLIFREAKQLDQRAKQLDEEAMTQIEIERNIVRQQVRGGLWRLIFTHSPPTGTLLLHFMFQPFSFPCFSWSSYLWLDFSLFHWPFPLFTPRHPVSLTPLNHAGACSFRRRKF